MGCRELIESLRAAGNGKMRALRAEAGQEAARIREEAESSIEALRAAHAHERALSANEQARRILADANAEARRLRLTTERALAGRLLALARASLAALRNVGYADVFASYVRELPSLPWKTVRVNPQDVERAQERFPGAEVVADAAITGGFTVLSAGGDVQVVNTLEQRLNSLWEEMLPELMKEARESER